jgi:hypothetical protein
LSIKATLPPFMKMLRARLKRMASEREEISRKIIPRGD